MTLYRQLLLFTCLLFVFLFVGTMLVKVHSTRVFLTDQLESHAQDTATSLGLSISPYLAEDDLATVETMMNAIFDHGYYQLIQLVDLEEQIQAERQMQVVISNVPAWFIRLVPLSPPSARILVTAGWRQMGYLTVVSHPGYAYKTMWEALWTTGKVFLATAVLVALLGAAGLRFLLQPLKKVEAQAEALCRREYSFQKKLPRTRELRRVVVAMNSMTEKVRQMFEEQAGVADGLRRSAYSDTLTGVGNRRYLNGQIEAHLTGKDQGGSGALLLVEVKNLLQLNQARGYRAGDRLLLRCSEVIKRVADGFVEAALARISGGSFALFLPDVTQEDAKLAASQIAEAFGQLGVEHISHTDDIGHVGGVWFRGRLQISEMLAEADRLLRAAQAAGPNGWQVDSLSVRSETEPKGELQWQELFTAVLKERSLQLFGQTVLGRSQGTPIHLELFAKISAPDNTLYNAGIFVPLAERLNRISAIDRLVVEKAMDYLRSSDGTIRVAINLSASSLRDQQFLPWLVELLARGKEQASLITFEFAEFGVTGHLERLLHFAKEVDRLGCGVGVDNFGKNFSNFGYLQSLRPRYVKIDKAFTAELQATESNSSFFISSLCSVAHSLDVMVIAEGVETAEQQQLLAGLQVDGFQGYHLDKPSHLI